MRYQARIRRTAARLNPSIRPAVSEITQARDPKQLRRDHIQRDKTGTFRGAMGGEGGNGTEKRP